eukprot:CAMPEP_0181345474 /NCGR_PEP_ID=MMETSP1101-20121128/32770_1 /TAXON_ID=46948 /ORGANISM="Rhodomonas abbreviata, Strain Caron Lab Isolate" /LENGTH=99 /DNA_ID=CAMNT_0023457435 /DNA_START=30 /DNA_END=329 /DNA_ORIENTATION=-
MKFFFVALCLVLAVVSASSANMQSPALRLRGGGVLSNLADSLGWHREKVGANELGCGPLPQVKSQNRHTDLGMAKTKGEAGDAMTRSHSFTIPDVANQR